jgi:hypothetical protein
LASDVILSEFAQSFLSRLNTYNRVLWGDLLDQFLDEPIRDNTIEFPESGESDAMLTTMGPFLITWRSLNAETLAILDIRWSPESPGGQSSLSQRL